MKPAETVKSLTQPHPGQLTVDPNAFRQAILSLPLITQYTHGGSVPSIYNKPPAAPALAPQPQQPQAQPGMQMFPSTPTNQSLPGLNTSGVNPYLSDPLMSSYYGMQSPYFQQQQPDFYGDPELFQPPTISGIGR